MKAKKILPSFQVSDTDPHMQAVCDNIDAWAMWLSPPAFLIFNMAYWFAYQHVETEPPVLGALGASDYHE